MSEFWETASRSSDAVGQWPEWKTAQYEGYASCSHGVEWNETCRDCELAWADRLVRMAQKNLEKAAEIRERYGPKRNREDRQETNDD